jgi:hypothetical protein
MSIKRRADGYRNIETLQKSDLFLLRWTKSLPKVMPEGSNFSGVRIGASPASDTSNDLFQARERPERRCARIRIKRWRHSLRTASNFMQIPVLVFSFLVAISLTEMADFRKFQPRQCSDSARDERFPIRMFDDKRTSGLVNAEAQSNAEAVTPCASLCGSARATGSSMAEEHRLALKLLAEMRKYPG